MRRFQIVVGNLYEEELAGRGGRHDRNTNKWTMYVALQGAANHHTALLIEKVVYTLHPTFKPSVVTAHGPHFSLCRYGWGTFAVGCEIHWQPRLQMPPTRVDHYLAFEDQGGRTVETVEIAPDRLAMFEGILEGAGGQRDAAVEQPGPVGAAVTRSRRIPPASQAGLARSRSPDGGPSELLQLVVGNRCEVVASDDSRGNQYRWTMYVALPGLQGSAGRLIDRVDYELHPTFQPNVHTRRSPRFELSCTGWGTFPVKCTIHWHRDLRLRPMSVDHDLVFEENGGCTVSTVGVHPHRLNAFR